MRCHKNRNVSISAVSPKEAKEGTVTVNIMDPFVKSPSPIKMPTKAMMTGLVYSSFCDETQIEWFQFVLHHLMRPRHVHSLSWAFCDSTLPMNVPTIVAMTGHAFGYLCDATKIEWFH